MTHRQKSRRRKTAIQKNDFAGAETLLKKALDKDPNNLTRPGSIRICPGLVLNR